MEALGLNRAPLISGPGCIPSKYKFKTQKYNKLRWLASDLNFKMLHTGCPNAHGLIK